MMRAAPEKLPGSMQRRDWCTVSARIAVPAGTPCWTWSTACSLPRRVRWDEPSAYRPCDDAGGIPRHCASTFPPCLPSSENRLGSKRKLFQHAETPPGRAAFFHAKSEGAPSKITARTGGSFICQVLTKKMQSLPFSVRNELFTGKNFAGFSLLLNQTAAGGQSAQ